MNNPHQFRGKQAKWYGLKDFYYTMVLSHRAVFRLIGNKIKPKIEDAFVERLMLAVTEVNGCEACSYVHTRAALKSGFSKQEIESFLSGSDAYIVPEEAKGILFAQHYADSRGKPEREAYENLIKEYGIAKSRVIISAIQAIMLGNAIGIPMSAFYARLKGSLYKNSSIFYEIGFPFIGVLLYPFSILHALLRFALRDPSNCIFSTPFYEGKGKIGGVSE